MLADQLGELTSKVRGASEASFLLPACMEEYGGQKLRVITHGIKMHVSLYGNGTLIPVSINCITRRALLDSLVHEIYIGN